MKNLDTYFATKYSVFAAAGGPGGLVSGHDGPRVPGLQELDADLQSEPGEGELGGRGKPHKRTFPIICLRSSSPRDKWNYFSIIDGAEIDY